MKPNTSALDSEYRPRVEDSACVSFDHLAADPVMSAEYERFDSLVTSGPTIESYRGLSAAELAGLADQGDSAAMAVLGAISVMRAMGLPEDEAVPFLLLEGPSVQSLGFERPLEPETEKHLEQARNWYYKAAVHGRLLALQNAGYIVAIVDGTPIELGWIQQDEYDSLASYERQALDPINVYGALAFDIAPELRTSPMGAISFGLTPGGDRQQLVLNDLAWRFRQDREAAGLPPIDLSESSAPSNRRECDLLSH